jgi:hypothetical protein
MTVKQLIEKLQAFPEEAEISVENFHDDTWNIVGIEFTGEFVTLKIEGDSFI